MACDTFIKIASKCKRHFVALQAGESEPFIDEIVRTLRKITIDLTPQQVHTFYEACGHMISAQGQKSQQERLIAELMSYPNQAVRSHLPSMSGLCLLEHAVGLDHQPSQQRSFNTSRRRDHKSGWQYYEDERCCLYVNR